MIASVVRQSGICGYPEGVLQRSVTKGLEDGDAGLVFA